MKYDLELFVEKFLNKRADDLETSVVEDLYHLEDFNERAVEAMKCRVAIKLIEKNGL